MIMCVLLCYPVSIHMSQLLSTGRPISTLLYNFCRERKGGYFLISVKLVVLNFCFIRCRFYCFIAM